MAKFQGLAAAGLTVLCTTLALHTSAQTGTDRTEGLRDNTPRWHAITGARLVLAPGQVLDGGTLVLRDGLIVAAGAGVPVPAGARVWSLPGRTVYAGFIDLHGTLALPAALRAVPPGRPAWGLGADLPPPRGPRAEPAQPTQRSAAARNRMVRAEQDVAAQLDWNADDARLLRELGFTAVVSAPQAGVFRGQGALLATGAAQDPKAAVIAPRVGQYMAFDIHRGAEGGYPTSLMGAIALARQTLLDARWYRGATTKPGPGERVEPNATLAALIPVLEGRQPVFFDAEDEQDAARLARLRDEFGLRAVLLGSGHEYRRVKALAASKLPVVLPLTYPAAPDLADPDSALDVPLSTLQHWEQAPSNAAVLHRAGVPLAFTAAGLRDAQRDFWPRLRQAVRRGLPAEQALAALTVNPAAWLGESARLGTLAPGRIANVVVARGDLFTSDDATIEMSFVDGRPLLPEQDTRTDPRGTWAVDGSDVKLKVAGTAAAPKLEGEGGPCELLARRGGEWLLRQPCGKGAEAAGSQIVAAVRGEVWAGTVQRGDGPLLPWSAKRIAVAPAAAASAPEADVPSPRPTYPAGAFGIGTPERPAAVLVRNATVWTQGPAGKLERADLLVRDGRIAAVGTGLAAPSGALVIDAAGKHLTPGLIDAHAHIAMTRGVNEFSHSVTAEVRVADVLDPTDIDIYRQLAGGLTTSNVMHGSANTIGGQTQVIKLRWGGGPEELVFEAAKPGIKFALGENVKRAGMGGSRYPGTRMGVEQVLRDSFQAAKEYAASWRDWRAKPAGRPEPRRDLRLETLVQILERQRTVHIHSYRADEILMFARLAKELNIEVAAFQHVLEGYKVADAMAAIGAGGSTFSDWWAYKMEVVDAIPHNGTIMQRAGVLTSFNSDDGELARRMNTEAAKAMKYGGASDVEALAFVTINPAKQLRVDARTGSLEVGKDADFVIWNAHPLSTYARAEQTWIDGRRYFDIETDRRLREEAATERARLVTAALRAPRPPSGAPPGAPRPGAPVAIAEADLGRMNWQRTFDAARSFRHGYSGLDAWHECTEDAP
jgi:imidazolonepropionase-like amidohydrolase